MEAVKKGKAKDGEERLLKEQLSYLLPPPLPFLVELLSTARGE